MSGPSRLRVRHVTDYRYSAPVLSSYNEVRVTPRTGPRQVVLDTRLETTPATRLRQYVDYWGTVVHVLDLLVPHDSLVIVGSTVVETGWPDDSRTGPPTTWEELTDLGVADRFVEFLAPTASVPTHRRIAAVADRIRSTCTPAEAPEAVGEWCRATLRYERGITGVHTSGLEAWDAERGVCQDFAHLALAVLRTMGVPSRYVSGYLHPSEDAQIGEQVIGESHAWIESWDGGRWVAADPTNGRVVGRDHVLVATGRDYADVAPVRGVYDGGGASALGVAVEITRLT
jgi:transglutaminase-like putative cysteine protease